MDREVDGAARVVTDLESQVSDDKLTPNTYDECHFGDVLQSWNNGVQLDVRTKLAVDFLKAGMLARPGELAHVLAGGPLLPEIWKDQSLARVAAAFALDLATELLNLSAERGLLKALPETDELTTPHRRHLERAMRAQVYPQTQGQRIMEEEGGDRRLAQLPPGTKIPLS